MAVEVWSVLTLKEKALEVAKKEFDNPDEGRAWYDSVVQLGARAAGRSDGLAIYVNEDFGHSDLGQWQVMSYGSEASQLETRHASIDERLNVFVHGDDRLPVTLPDIGGRINWRYQLHAIVPSYEQQAKADAKWVEPQNLWAHLQVEHQHDLTGLTDADLSHWQERHREKLHSATAHVPVPHTHEPCSHPGCVYREGHDLDLFPHRVEDGTHDRLVVVQVKVSGGATEEEAKTIVSRVVESGLANWHDSAGEIGFSAEESLGVDAFDKGVDVHFVDAVVI